MIRLAFIIAMLVTGVVASGQHSGRGRLKVPKAATIEAIKDAVCDTVVVTPSDTLVQITGYEKPREASRETFFVRNLTDRYIDGIELEITYFTTGGEELHRRTIDVAAQLPAGERRMLSIKSWDVNRMFYYHINVPNTSRQATPYRVIIKPKRLYVRP